MRESSREREKKSSREERRKEEYQGAYRVNLHQFHNQGKNSYLTHKIK